MPAAPVLTDDIIEKIARIYLRDKTQPAKAVLGKLHEELGQTDWPKLSVVQRELKKIKNPDQQRQDKELEKSWHLGLMNQYDISPEALPYIFLVQEWLEKYPDIFKNPPPQAPLTIRETLWVARLRGMLNDLRLAKRKDLPTIAEFLFLWAKAYSQRESICGLAGIPFETSLFDKAIREHAYPITIDKTTIIHYGDKTLDIDSVDQDLLKTIDRIKREGAK